MRKDEWRMTNVGKPFAGVGLLSSFGNSAFVMAAACLFSMPPDACGGEWLRELKAFRGSTPKVDGVIEAEEWRSEEHRLNSSHT
jgi:hypothetical protein